MSKTLIKKEKSAFRLLDKYKKLLEEFSKL
jgi:hypothetical protein